jgi:putative transcriptional regulator
MLLGDMDLPEDLDEEDEITPVVPGLNFAGSMDVFRFVAADPPPRLRFFLGYAGWGPGQLEFEITQGAWLSAEATAETVFRVPPESMWDHVVRGLGIDPSTLVSTSGIH